MPRKHINNVLKHCAAASTFLQANVLHSRIISSGWLKRQCRSHLRCVKSRKTKGIVDPASILFMPANDSLLPTTGLPTMRNAHGPSNTRRWAKLRRSRSKQSRNFTRQSARSMSSYGAHCKLDSTPTVFPLRSGLLPSASAKRPFACPEHLQLLSRTLSWDDS